MHAITHKEGLALPLPAVAPVPAAQGGTAPAATRTGTRPVLRARVRLPAFFRAAWQRGIQMPLSLWLAWSTVAVVLVWALVPGWFSSYDPLVGQAGQQLQAPSAAHWLGTDALGRDVWSRVVHGAVHSLTGALVAVSLGLVAGTLLGVLAGAVGGRVDDVLMRVVDVLLAVPSLLLSLAIISLLGFGTVNAALAVGVASVATFARLVRAEVVRVRRTEYVEAAFGSGAGFVAVLWRHIVPNSLTSVAALAALQFGSAILSIATLGFLGYGAPPPTPEWGLLIAEGRNYLATAWWLTTVPGLVVVAVVLAVNRISAALSGGHA